MNTPEKATQGVARTVSKSLVHAGISQRTASSQTGIPLTTLHRRLTGNSPFTVTELTLLANILDTSVSELFALAKV